MIYKQNMNSTEDIFEKEFRKAQNNDLKDFDLKVTNEKSLKLAFDYIINIVGEMSSRIEALGDLTDYKSLFFGEIDPENKIFNNIVDRITVYGEKAKRVCGLINEYLYQVPIADSNNVECDFRSDNISNAVNRKTHIAQTVVRNYKGKLSIEIPCQVYNLVVDEFNSSINLLNKQRKLSVPQADVLASFSSRIDLPTLALIKEIF